MTRLADYFCVVGVEEQTELYDQKELKGCMIQRFPENDWKHVPCPQGLEHFCLPGGWRASKKNKPPTFCISILTDMEGKPSYLACLSFHEMAKDEQSNDNKLEKPVEKLYVPKCLCLISRQRYYDILKNCLTTIFVAYLNRTSTDTIEKMIGTAIGFVHVPPPGGPKLTFSLGGGDNQVLQPPLDPNLPCTNESVAILFNQLGINSMLHVFTALVTECKILLLSASYNHLTMAAEALTALLYPLKFNYVFIPVLPSGLLDFLSAPTPFLMGVHMSYSEYIPELFDVVIVNIDEGFVTVPDSIRLASIPEPYYDQVLESLKIILTPSLFSSDILFPTNDPPPSLALQDKEIRAVFIKLFADMFCGYRSCLTLIRVHPKPVISFNKLAFMEKRCFIGDDFFSKVLDSVGFSAMTQSRGPPYREVDMFDELIANAKPLQEKKSAGELIQDLLPIVDHLCQNEPRFDNPEASVLPVANPEVLLKPLRQFPFLNEIEINSFLTAKTSQGKIFTAPVIQPQQVPINQYDHPGSHYINQRRLEVIQDCVQYIYDSKISEARKALPSVLRALKSKGAQYALCNELESRVKFDSAMLDHDQYHLIIRLLNAALQDDNTVNSTNIAVKIIPLAAAFHRKLGPSAIQFAYTSVQEHAVWSNIQFWEEAFYSEAQRQIVELHIKEKRKKIAALAKAEAKNSKESKDTVKKTQSDAEVEAIRKAAEKTLSPEKTNHRNSMLIAPSTPSFRNRTATVGNAHSSPEGKNTDTKNSLTKEIPDAMKLAAELLSEYDSKTETEKQTLIYEEESIVYSLTMLFAQRMMFLRVPTNACVEMRKIQQLKRQQYERRLQQQQQQQLSVPGDSSGTPTEDTVSIATRPSNSIMNDAASTFMGESVMGGSSSGWGSQHDLTDGAFDFGESVKDTTSKFILRFVERVCIEAGVTAAHLKSLQTNIPMLVGMHIESLEEVYRETKDAPTQKAKIMKPAVLPGEKTQFDGLRCYLISDGRELGVRTEENIIRPNDSYDDEINVGADNGGPCLFPAEGALFLTNYRVVFKGTPIDQFASEMTVTRSFPIGSLIKEKKVTGTFTVYPSQIANSYLQLRSSTMQMMKLAFDEEVLPETIDNFRKSLVKSRWPQSVYNTFAFNYKAPPVLQRTLSQRQQSIRKTHKTLTNVVNLKKKVGQGSVKKKSALAEDNTIRKYEAVSKENINSDDEDKSDMEQVLFEQEQRGPDRLRESALCKDYERLGLGGITKILSSPWRLSMANFHYSVCRSYPAIVVVPSPIKDDVLLKVAKNHRLSRFPVAVWRHRKTKGTLLRSGTINKSLLTAVLKTGLGGQQTQGYHSANITDDEKFFTEIVSATHLYTLKGKHQTVSAGAAPSMKAMSDDFASLFDGAEQSRHIASDMDEVKQWEPAHLYIFTDKASSKGTKMESSNRVVVVNVEIHDVTQVKTSFSKLVKVCCPSSSNIEKSFFGLFEESKWLSQISSLLQVACSIVNLMDIQGSSCLVSFGDGSEVTSQVISLVQLLSDPYYRTIDGFKVLIEKDWLAFGYRFSHRGNHVLPQTAIAPFFLQFLDCVHQILLQFPHAFEFNNYLLKFMAYHQTSMRFNTFFLDSEHERYQHGWFPDCEAPKEDIKAKTADLQNKAKQGALNFPRQKKDGSLKAEQLAQQHQEQKKKKSTSVSLWDHLKMQAARVTLFQSFSYHPDLNKNVLRPFCNVSNLEIWDYYTSENLYTGPIYDLELFADLELANVSNEGGVTANPDIDREDFQTCLNGCYGNTQDIPRDEATYLLNELNRLKEELDQKTQHWTATWDDLKIKDVLKRQTRMQWHLYWEKDRRMAVHKRTTIDMVTKGKVTENNQVRSEFGFEYPHTFVNHSYIRANICNYCLQSITGYHGGFQCTQCGFNVHEKCQSMVPAQCPKHISLNDQPAQQLSLSNHSLPGMERSNQRNFKGTLYKRGHLLRQWKARWFVLDAQRNHLTYYDSEEDTQLQGYIDLGELRACRLVNPPPHAPKWADRRSFFELETTKRCYYLLAPKSDTASEWLDRLNALNA